MNDRFDVVFHDTPGIRVRFGGSRRLDQNSLVRPWQKQTTLVEGPCALCAAVKDGANVITQMPGWAILRTLRSNYEGARLLVSDECPETVDLVADFWRRKLHSALAAAQSIVTARDTFFGIQAGGLAGGSILHPHAHVNGLEGAPRSRAARQEFVENDRTFPVIKLFPGSVAIAAGTNTGQCFLLPRVGQFSNEGEPCMVFALNENIFLEAEETARSLAHLLGLYRVSFKSNGLAPEYQIGVVFADHKIVYATLVPVLSQPGVGDTVALFERRAKPVAWPHDETARFLREG